MCHIAHIFLYFVKAKSLSLSLSLSLCVCILLLFLMKPCYSFDDNGRFSSVPALCGQFGLVLLSQWDLAKFRGVPTLGMDQMPNLAGETIFLLCESSSSS